MKRYISKLTQQRIMALILVIILYMPAAGLSQGTEQPISIALLWSEGESGMVAEALPVPYPGYENSYWLFIPAEALDKAPMISITDNTGKYASFSIPDGTQLPDFEDAGDTLSGVPLEIIAYDQGGQEAAHIRLYISTTTEQPLLPEPTETPVREVVVTVHYRTVDGLEVASSQRFTCTEGENLITAQPFDLLPGYKLTGSSQQTVFVSGSVADNNEVVFLYGIPVIAPVDIMVYYKAEDNNDIAAPQAVTCTAGTNAITAAPVDLPEGFTLQGESVQYVIVTAEGANIHEVIFRYSYAEPVTEPPVTAEPDKTPAPTPVIVFVSVYYRDIDGNTLWAGNAACVEGEPNQVAADLAHVPDGYMLVGESVQFVSVGANGAATPGVVEFLFAPPDITPVTAEITIRYLDKNLADIAAAQLFTCNIGNNIISARPEGLPSGYVLISEPMQSVTLSQDGTLSVPEVLFYYAKSSAAEPTPAKTNGPAQTTDIPIMTETPAPHYDIVPMDAFCYPTKDGINFRSSPTTKENNVLSVINQSTLGHITGKLTNSAGEIWYSVTIGNIEGYLKETVIQVLTHEEITGQDQTPTPVPVITAKPTEIPDGAIIDLWAQVSSKSVRFRSSPAVNSKNIIQTLNTGNMAWIYSSMTVDDKKWYVARANGKDGYVMADYVSLYSQQESDLYQSRLPSPMPLQTPGITQMPEMTYMPVLTEPPTTNPEKTGSPVPTSSPLPYTGYALTVKMAALRTGISMTDEVILTTLPAQTLVYISGQVYVDGGVWDFAESMGLSGYLPDSALRRITAEEADYYRQLQEPTSEPAPTATKLPPSYGGYAITMGGNVPMRSFADTNAMIVNILPENTIVQVIGQEYTDGTAWHIVQHAAQWGYIREDQLRMLNDLEVTGYLSSLRTPLPSPVLSLTPAPITPDSPSSYGYVNTDRVRLRKGAGTDTAQIKMLNKYAFALVLGTQTGTDGKLWYKVSQAGTEGYILSDYFKVLPLGGLTEFLQSPEYLNAGADTNNNGTPASTNITSIEDFNNGVWTNPILANASYEPFNPFASATPSFETIATPTPAPTATELPVSTFSSLPPLTTDESNKDNGFLIKLIAGVLIIAGGGGGVYAYTLYRKNQRRAAERAAQRRNAQAMARNGQPYTQPAPTGSQAVPPYTAPFLPPQGGAPRPPQPSGSAAAGSTRAYPAVNPYAPPQTQAAKPYTPVQTSGRPAMTSTQPYIPPQKPPEVQSASTNPASIPAQDQPVVRHRRSDKHSS